MQENTKSYRVYVRTGTLSQVQENAMSLVLAGQSDQAIATRLKIGRATVNRWRLHHPTFVAELNRRRTELRARTMDSLRSLAPRAIDTIRDQVVNGDGHLALAYLARSGIFGSATTGPLLYADIGPTDPQAVVDEEVRRRRADGRLPMPALPAALPTPASPSSTDATGATPLAAVTSGGTPSAAVEPPITDEERDAVLADLLAEDTVDAPPDSSPEPNDASHSQPALPAPPGNGAAGHVVTTGSMSSFG
jgi:hypothetical protein